MSEQMPELPEPQPQAESEPVQQHWRRGLTLYNGPDTSFYYPAGSPPAVVIDVDMSHKTASESTSESTEG